MREWFAQSNVIAQMSSCSVRICEEEATSHICFSFKHSSNVIALTWISKLPSLSRLVLVSRRYVCLDITAMLSFLCFVKCLKFKIYVILSCASWQFTGSLSVGKAGLETDNIKTALDVLAAVAAVQESPPRCTSTQRVPSPQLPSQVPTKLGFQPVPLKAAVPLASIVRPVPSYVRRGAVSFRPQPQSNCVVIPSSVPGMTMITPESRNALPWTSISSSPYGWPVSSLYSKSLYHQSVPQQQMMYFPSMQFPTQPYVQRLASACVPPNEHRLSHTWPHDALGTTRLQHVSPPSSFMGSMSQPLSHPTLPFSRERHVSILSPQKRLKRLSSSPSRFVHVVPNMPWVRHRVSTLQTPLYKCKISICFNLSFLLYDSYYFIFDRFLW